VRIAIIPALAACTTALIAAASPARADDRAAERRGAESPGPSIWVGWPGDP
jgi:hypothetical protein